MSQSIQDEDRKFVGFPKRKTLKQKLIGYRGWVNKTHLMLYLCFGCIAYIHEMPNVET